MALPPMDDNDMPPRHRPSMDEVDNDAPPPGAVGLPNKPVGQNINVSTTDQTSMSATMMMSQNTTAQAQAQASVGLAQTNIDTKIVDHQIKKEDEHWVKAYWRPAMGWLYMLICFMDFIVFPALAMFLPVIMKGFGVNMSYTAWQSLSLSNGGMMHLAFGAILGVAAWTRGSEKIANINSGSLPVSNYGGGYSGGNRTY